MDPDLPLRATVDRIEQDEEGNEIAVLVFEDGQQLALPRALLPPGAEAQRVLRIAFEADADETARRARQIEDLQHGLFGDG